MHPSSPPSRSADQRCVVGVLERQRALSQRAARVLRAASGLANVAVEADPASLRELLSDAPRLLACDVSDVDLALEWGARLYPELAVVAWTSGAVDPLLEAARRSPRLVSLIGWPSFASMPRPWEIALAARRVLDPQAPAPRLSELLAWGATAAKYRPRTSRERDDVTGEVRALAERAGAPPRVAERVAEVAHEMLMNAMYDAPVDASGHAPYAHDRKRDVELSAADAPVLRFCTDGVHVALQVQDPFGRLTRAHVLDGIARGRGAAGGGLDVLDTSGGGAGLGLYRIYAQSAVMIVDVEPGARTSVTAFFDLDVNPRELRNMPVSLHVFDGSLGGLRGPAPHVSADGQGAAR